MFPAGSFDEVPHDGMRKTIARRLTEAKQTIPHFYLAADCELDALLELREQINAAAPKDKDGKPAFKVSVNDFVIKALALALMRVPEANVTWTEGAMLKHKHADVGVAVSIPGGLITPDHPRGRHQDAFGHLQRDEGFCGPRAGQEAEAGGIPRRHRPRCPTSACSASRTSRPSSTRRMPPSWRSARARSASWCKGDAPAVATVMTCTLSTDHRAVDGALGAELMAGVQAAHREPDGHAGLIELTRAVSCRGGAKRR